MEKYEDCASEEMRYCMCNSDHDDPDIREEYCDGTTMTVHIYSKNKKIEWWLFPPQPNCSTEWLGLIDRVYYYCAECGVSEWADQPPVQSHLSTSDRLTKKEVSDG